MGFKDASTKKWQHLAANEAITAPWIVKRKQKQKNKAVTDSDESLNVSGVDSFSMNYERLFSLLLLMDILSVCLLSMVISQWVSAVHWPLYLVNVLAFASMAFFTRLYLLSDSQYMLGKFIVITGVSLIIESMLLLFFQTPMSEIVCSLALMTGVYLVLAVMHHGLTASLIISHKSGLYYEIECRIKRVFDWVMSLILLLLTGPLLGLIAIGIFLLDRGPAIFKQTRIGLEGKNFTLFKFRSMCLNAESVDKIKTLKNKEQNKKTDKAYKTLFKMENDPRITFWGRLLRNFSLDELPQLVNVLRGEMSLVGPRPPLPVEFNEMTEYHRRKFDVPPGMTGLWQITGRVKNERNFDAVAGYDIDYIEKWSVFKDMTIILKTIPVVLGQKGAS